MGGLAFFATFSESCQRMFFLYVLFITAQFITIGIVLGKCREYTWEGLPSFDCRYIHNIVIL